MTERIYNFSAGPAVLPVAVLEEVQRDVFLGSEIVKDGAFGDAGLARNRPGRCGLESLRLEEGQGGGYDALPDRFFVARAQPHGTLRRAAAALLRCRCWFPLRGHKTIREYAHQNI